MQSLNSPGTKELHTFNHNTILTVTTEKEEARRKEIHKQDGGLARPVAAAIDIKN